MLTWLWSIIVRSGLVLSLGLINYSIWFTPDGFPKHQELSQLTAQVLLDNKHLQKDTKSLQDAVANIKSAGDILERKAREDLNMVGPGEKLYRVLGKSKV